MFVSIDAFVKRVRDLLGAINTKTLHARAVQGLGYWNHRTVPVSYRRVLYDVISY